MKENIKTYIMSRIYFGAFVAFRKGKNHISGKK